MSSRPKSLKSGKTSSRATQPLGNPSPERTGALRRDLKPPQLGKPFTGRYLGFQALRGESSRFFQEMTRTFHLVRPAMEERRLTSKTKRPPVRKPVIEPEPQPLVLLRQLADTSSPAYYEQRVQQLREILEQWYGTQPQAYHQLLPELIDQLYALRRAQTDNAPSLLLTRLIRQADKHQEQLELKQNPKRQMEINAVAEQFARKSQSAFPVIAAQ